jgi:hypothetical protein
MSADEHIKTGKVTTLVSFLIGTAIFGLYFLTSAFQLLAAGYVFIAIAAIINLIILTRILVTAFKDKINRKKLLLTSGLMIINIPVMLVYCSIGIVLLNTMRITFTNATGKILTDINIVGCEPKHIDKLEKGESKTIWIGITGDCTLNVDYVADKQRIEENVAGYVTNNMGQKMKYKIGGHNEKIF